MIFENFVKNHGIDRTGGSGYGSGFRYREHVHRGVIESRSQGKEFFRKSISPKSGDLKKIKKNLFRFPFVTSMGLRVRNWRIHSRRNTEKIAWYSVNVMWPIILSSKVRKCKLKKKKKHIKRKWDEMKIILFNAPIYCQNHFARLLTCLDTST